MDMLTSVRKAMALSRLAALEMQDAQLFAAKAQALMDLEEVCRAQPDPALHLSLIALDIATACTIAQRTATGRLDQARRLQLLPQTAQALAAGQLGVGQALALLDETAVLSTEACAEVERQALPQILGFTSGDTRRLVKKVVAKVDADASDRRRAQQHTERKVWSSPRPDGRAFIGAEQSAEDAVSFLLTLKELARRTFSPADPRNLDQQCADLFSQLPHFALGHLDAQLGGPPAPSLWALLGLTEPNAQAHTAGTVLTRQTRRRTQAVVLVPVDTGLDLTDNPADLIGYGPITAGHARELLAVAELRKACVDIRTGRMVALEDRIVRPAGARWDTGQSGPDHRVEPRSDHRAERRSPRPPRTLEQALIDMIERPTPVEARDEDQHDPSTGLTDFLRLRDTRCSGPGCAQPAHLCDLEHLTPHPKGRTTANNLGPASRRCHNAKTHGGWSLQPHPDGSVTWSSPLGRQFTRPSRTTPPDLSNLRPPRRTTPSQKQPPTASDDESGQTSS